jgi:hypothetical protein
MLVGVGSGAVVVVASCASTPGAQPHDMSAAQHEAMAAAEADAAAAHAAQYEPQASAPDPCIGGAKAYGGCWTSRRNPTAEHLDEAKKHEKMAADHRAASQALRDAEARACVGVSEADRDMSPFAHRDDITAVQPATVHISGKQPRDANVGAIVMFRAVPGMTAEWLQRVVDCHLARNAALGHEVPEMPYCPLVPNYTTATVTSEGDGFAVFIASTNADSAREIGKRASTLAPAR